MDASYQVSVYSAKLCQRRFLEIDQSEKRIVCGGHMMFANKLGQNEQSL